MTIQSIIQIGHILRNAVVFNAKNWPGDTMNSDSLIQSVQELFTVLEEREIDYVLVGGIALLHYVEGRNTQDIDLLMASSSLLLELSNYIDANDFAEINNILADLQNRLNRFNDDGS